VSALRGHKAVLVEEVPGQAVRLKQALSAGAGLALDVGLSDLLSVGAELQYTFYRASGRLVYETAMLGRDFDRLYEVGVNLHALEIPVLARFDLGSYYAEVGPQLGFNLSSKMYINGVLYQPRENLVAFGPTAGGGLKLGDGLLLGLRCHFGIIEYAERSKGYPWAVQASATKFLF
jgi:hypothetical protein